MIDVLIVGQGVAGSILAYKLLRRKKEIRIIDPLRASRVEKIVNRTLGQSPGNTQWLNRLAGLYPLYKSISGNRPIMSRVIGGLITPVTGKRLLKTWMADEFIPYASHFYHNLEIALQASFFQEQPIVRIFASAEQANEWSVKSVSPEYSAFIENDYSFTNRNLNAPHGLTVFRQGAVVNGALMLEQFNTFFEEKKCLIREPFRHSDLKVQSDYIQWKNIIACRIIFCEGWKAIENPLFNLLPFMPSKGELLVIQSKKLQLQEIINRGIFIRPLFREYYLVGSTYSWKDLSLNPTSAARKELQEKLDGLLKVPYKIVDHFAGIRPTVKNRRPFIGVHPQKKNVYIFNGLGTKGLLLAPYLANHFCEYLYDGKELMPEVDIQRFY